MNAFTLLQPCNESCDQMLIKHISSQRWRHEFDLPVHGAVRSRVSPERQKWGYPPNLEELVSMH